MKRLMILAAMLLPGSLFALPLRADDKPPAPPEAAVRSEESPAAQSGEKAQDEAPAGPLSVEELTARVRQSVVVISFLGRDGKPQGVGSGFVVSEDGLIATNLHVIGEARPIRVQLADGREFEVVEVHATEKSADLAVVRIHAKNLRPLPLGDSDALVQGQDVVAIGNPRGLEHSVVAGVVSGFRDIEDVPMIQLAIPIESGNSGGPLLDRHGRVQGVLTLKSLVTENLGFAVRINAIRPLLDKPNPVPIARWLTIGTLDPGEWTPLFGARWQRRAGRISVEGAGRGFGGRSLCLSMLDLPEKPYEVAVEVRLQQTDGAAGLVIHSDGDERHYGFYPSGSEIRFARFDGPDVFQWNVLHQSRSPHLRIDDWNRIKVRVEEDRLIGYLNDEKVVEITDRRYRSGRVGLAKFRHTTAEFRNFRVAKSIPPGRPDDELVGRIAGLTADLDPSRPAQADLIEKLIAEDELAGRVLQRQAEEFAKRSERLRELAVLVHEERTRRQLAAVADHPDGEVDLLHASLLIARLDNPDLEIEPYLRQVERFARELQESIPDDATPQQRLDALNEFFFAQLSFHGSRTDYYSRSNSYLNEVVDDREGLPITLSVLYMDLARRVGMKMVGVGLPGHFVVRYEPEDGEEQLIDVFDGGRKMSRDDAARKVRSITRRTLSDDHLASQSPRAILSRMLYNLMGLARDEGDAAAMLRYVETMVVLSPESAQDRWYRAVLYYQTGRIDESLADVEWLLETDQPGVDNEQVAGLRRRLLQVKDEQD